jgi:MoaA/NifB/PqqE/SkfB family radical SAM enzyme
LLGLVRMARRLGYQEIALQTNGIRLAYEHYRSAALAAGVTEVRLNVKSHRAETHDRLSGGERCHGFLLEALAGLAHADVRRVADVLLTRSTAADLPETVAFFAERGVQSFALWLLSAADSADPDVAAEVPRIADVVPQIASAFESARRLGVGISSLHTPPCTLEEELRPLFAPASELSLVVVGPDARPFALEQSPFEGGAYTAACSACSERGRCGGPRADYLRIHGDREFVAIPAPPDPLGWVPR